MLLLRSILFVIGREVVKTVVFGLANVRYVHHRGARDLFPRILTNSRLLQTAAVVLKFAALPCLLVLLFVEHGFPRQQTVVNVVRAD